MPTLTKEATFYRCSRCGYEWMPRSQRKPEVCPRCKSPYWGQGAIAVTYPPDSLRLVFDRLPASQLTSNGRRRLHPFTQMKWTRQESDSWLILFRALRNTSETSPKWPAFRRCGVSITLTYPIHRRRDLDGLYGAIKPLLDVLVSEGVIEDDDSEHIMELSLAVQVQKGVSRTEVAIEEIGKTTVRI